MATAQQLPAALGGLARKLEATIADPALARRAARMVQDHAADGQLALATLMKLAEESPPSMREALADRGKARDLVICLGASEVVSAEIVASRCAMASNVRRGARARPRIRCSTEMRCDLSAIETRADAARELSLFKRRIFFRIAVADLIGQIDVQRTMLLMSRLADECIRAACGSALRLVGERASEAGNFASSRWASSARANST